ncbi:reverse transcriptase domain-containing protein, partial [Tanacetum coccineum]
SDHTTAMNMALALIAKAFKVNTIPTNNNQRSSLIPRNSQIAQLGMNTSQDIKMQMVDDNVGKQMRHNAVQNDGNEGLSVVLEIANQYGNGNVKTTPAKGNGNGINGNPIRCYNCRGEGHYASNCTVKSRKQDMLMKKQRVKVNCTSKDTLQQASTSGTQSDNAPVYDSDGSTEVSELKGTTKGTRTNTMFTKQSILGKPPSSSYKPELYSITPFPKSLVLPKVDKTNALSKLVTSNLAPSTQESKVVKIINVIAPRIFRTNPSKTSTVDNVVPNKPVKTSIRIKPITVSQPNVIHNQQATSDSNGFPSTIVNNTAKTKRPHPRSNSNTDRVPFKSMTSFLSNNVEKIEENHRNS